MVDPEGRVTKYNYDASGTRRTETLYPANFYDVSGLAVTDFIAETTLLTWAGNVDLTTTGRTEWTYDARGNVQTVASYSKVLSTGAFDTASELNQVTYVYDQAGNLLSRQSLGSTRAETFIYDGLGRLIGSTDANGTKTNILFNDSASQTVVTLANGLTQTSVYNLAGELLSYIESNSSNFLPNPLLLTDTAGWTLGNAQRVAGAAGDPLPFLFQNTDPAGGAMSTTAWLAVPQGTTFDLSYTAKPGKVSQQLTVGIYWFDANGACIKTDYFNEFPTDTANFATYTYQVVKPANATHYAIYNGTYTSGPGAAAKWGGLQLRSNNFLPNPLLLTDTAGWTLGNAQRVAGVAGDPLPFLFQNTDPAGGAMSTTAWLAVPQGTAFDLSYTAKPGKVSQQLTVGIYWFDANGACIKTDYFNEFPTDTANFATYTYQVVKPANATHYAIYNGTYTSGPGAAAKWGGLKLAPAKEASIGIAVDTYRYDRLGRLRIETDATGLKIHHLYDAAGRKIADIDGDGSLTEYGYGANDLLINTVHYSTKLSTAQLASFTDVNGNPTSVALAAVRPTGNAADRWEWHIYDKSKRLIETIDAVGAATVNVYDGASRLLSTTTYANLVAQANLDTYKINAPTLLVLPSADVTNDRVSRYFYDRDGLLIGKLDGEGAFTQHLYDAAGKKTRTIAYATPTPAVLRANGSFDELLSSVTPTSYNNFLPNPLLLTDTAGWTLGNAQRVAGAAGDPLPFLFQNTDPAGGAMSTTAWLAVPQGTTFDLSYTAKPGKVSQQLTVGIYWFDANGACIKTDYFNEFPTDTANFATYTYQVVKPANATHYAIYNGTYTSGPGAAAKWGGLRLRSNNFLPNPLLLTDTAGWTLGNAQRVAGVAGDPLPFLFQNTDPAGGAMSTTAWLAVPQGTAFDLSYTAKPGKVSQQLTVGIYWFDANGACIKTDYFNEFPTDTANFATYTYQVVKPANATHYSIYNGTYTSGLGAAAKWGGLKLAPTKLMATSAINPKDIRTSYIYDARGSLAAEIDGEGNLTRYRYDAQGYLDQEIRGQKLDPATLLLAAPTLAGLPVAPAGTVLETVTYTRNAYGQILTEVKALGGGVSTTTTYQYDQMRRLTGKTTQAGGAAPRTATERYDLRGRLIGELSAEGSATLAALGGSANQAQVDAIYATYGTTYAYDNEDRLISMTEPKGANPSGPRTLYYYNLDGDLAYAISPLGEVMEYRYDALGQRTDTIQYANRIAAATLASMKGGIVSATVTATVTALANAPLDSLEHVDYNVTGTVKQSSDALGTFATYDYNAFRELKTRVDPREGATSTQTSITYDRRGLKLTEKRDSAAGGLQLLTTYGYDAFGRQIQVTDPKNFISKSGYDRAGRLTSSTDALNQVTTYTYDARDNLVAVSEPLGRISRSVYDAASRLTWSVDAAGAVVQRQYDADGRVISAALMPSPSR